MTRARTTKSIVRARMAKTGERYTTARRHVLSAAPVAEVSRPAVVGPAPPPVDVDPRGAVSDAKVAERTGRGLAHWFDVLDRFGAVTLGHTAAARHLRDDHGVPGWYAQGITVAYERAHGLRSVNQRPGGTFDFGVSRIVPASVAEVRALLTDGRRRRACLRDVDRQLARVLAAGVAGRASSGFVARSRGQAACRFPWGGSVVELMLTPRADGRSTIHVQHGKLPSRAAVEAYRPLWRAVLTAIAGLWPTPPRPSAGHRRTGR